MSSAAEPPPVPTAPTGPTAEADRAGGLEARHRAEINARLALHPDPRRVRRALIMLRRWREDDAHRPPVR
ncbi:MAG TPA: hypothetical protein VHX88_18355 [Solirubrobacteraceae bacterium]|jgi:hypothetical protein|nr:hypothetical protein [Solirubrobacteraceae bacterium]